MGQVLIRKSRKNHHCEICGKSLPAGTLCYNRDGAYGTVRCLSCHAQKKKEWEDKRYSKDKLAERLISELLDPSSDCRIDISTLFDSNRTCAIVLNKLSKKGYEVEETESGYYLIDSPEIRKFIDDFHSLCKDIFCAEYEQSWGIFLRGILLKMNYGGKSLRKNIEELPVLNDLYAAYNFIEWKYEEILSTYYQKSLQQGLDKISQDNEIYEAVCADIRQIVFHALVDELFELSGVTDSFDDSSVTIAQIKKEYMIFLDEPVYGDSQICDLEIIISEYDIICVDNSDEYGGNPVSISEYLNLNEDMCGAVGYICRLKGSGF